MQTWRTLVIVYQFGYGRPKEYISILRTFLLQEQENEQLSFHAYNDEDEFHWTSSIPPLALSKIRCSNKM